MTVESRRFTRRKVLESSFALAAGAAVFGPAQVFAQGIPGLLTKPIPSSGERVPLIGIGTARRYDVAVTEADMAPLREVIANMPRLGCTMIDTAPSYGSAEAVLGNLMRELGNADQMFIATKVAREDAAGAREEIEQSFRTLGVDTIDLLQLHNMVGVTEVLPLLRDLKAEGRIRYYGVTTSFSNRYEQMEQVLTSEELDFIQVDYAIDNRASGERIIPMAADRGVAVQINVPLGRGSIFEVFANQAIPGWAAELGISTWAQFALKYVVSHPHVTCAIPGTARLDYLEDNMQASMGVLPDAATRQRMAEMMDSGVAV